MRSEKQTVLSPYAGTLSVNQDQTQASDAGDLES